MPTVASCLKISLSLKEWNLSLLSPFASNVLNQDIHQIYVETQEPALFVGGSITLCSMVCLHKILVPQWSLAM